MGNTSGKTASKRQANARPLLRLVLHTLSERTKFVFCGPEPAERAGDIGFISHASILVLTRKMARAFDPRMPVL